MLSEKQIHTRAPIAIGSLCMSIVVLIWVGLLYDSNRSERTALQQGRKDASNLAIAFRENVTGIMSAIDQLTIVISADHSKHPDDFSIPEWVDKSPLLQGLALQVAMSGPDGIVRTSNLRLDGRVDLSDRPHFRYHLDPSASQPYISVPVIGRVSKKWSVQVTRRLMRDDNRFDGVVVISIDPFYLSKFFDSVNIGKNGSASLVGRDGIVRARRALNNQGLGRDLTDSDLFRNLKTTSDGTYITVGKLNEIKSLIGYASLQAYPLIVTTVIPIDDILAAVRRQNSTYMVVGGIATIAIMVLAWILMRESKRRRQHELAQHAHAVVQEQKERLDAALDNMAQGLLMFDGAGRLAVSNRRFAEMYKVPWEQWSVQALGMTVSQAMQLRHELNKDVTTQNTAEIIAAVTTVLDRRASSIVVSELSDGRALRTSISPMSDGGFVATFDDITERRRKDEQIVHMAQYDALTNLPNRTTFRETLEATISRTAATGEQFAILSIDLDHFKEANDTFGHLVGDHVLSELGRRLQTSAQGAFIARLGGDEFVVIVTDGAQPAAAAALAAQMLATVADDFEIEGHRLKCGMTIGGAIYPTDGTDAKTLMTNADAALYRAKAEFPGTVLFFEPIMSARLLERYALQEDLRSALGRSELLLHYQPQVKMSGETIGFEALARWQSRKRGMVPPDTFIPIAEESGLIMEVGEWVLREACREAASWPKPLVIAVNVSPIQFRHGDLPNLVHSILFETGLSPGRLELEITESVLVNDFSRAISILHRLKSLGVRIAMDDFGTGYSSLSYLHCFSFDKIKIDQIFISDLESNHHSRAIVRAVIGLGRSLELPILAEGVETKAQYALLQQKGCDEVQGFLTGRPLPIADYAKSVGRQTIARNTYAAAS